MLYVLDFGGKGIPEEWDSLLFITGYRGHTLMLELQELDLGEHLRHLDIQLVHVGLVGRDLSKEVFAITNAELEHLQDFLNQFWMRVGKLG